MDEPFRKLHEKMIATQILARGGVSEEIVEAFRKVPRHLFVPKSEIVRCFDDKPTPIGDGATLSQPYMVALMLQALEVKKGDRILEVGSGSGYVLALLSELGAIVYGIELNDSLVNSSRKILSECGYSTAKVKRGDGWEGWKEEAPFDLIISSAAVSELPRALISQLSENGSLLIPFGEDNDQELILVHKSGEVLDHENFGGVRFVPLVKTKP